MCGISGFFQPFGEPAGSIEAVIRDMADALAHRGPDSSDVWIKNSHGLALGHRRLAIIDTSDAGAQPMRSPSGRYVIVFNGEIYNHRKLREAITAELGNQNWRGSSDTETLLAAIELWGLKEALKRCVGMFALALWDEVQGELSLARDRLGEKPLYYGINNGVFYFASELKSLKKHPNFVKDIDRDALALFFRHGYIPGPHCIYKKVYKLAPGTLLTCISDDIVKSHLPTPTRYWDFKTLAERGLRQKFTGSFSEAREHLRVLLSRSISDQMVADVPLGAFLSGGIDSSTVVALMQAQSGRAVRTYTVGFNESGYNEANFAKSVADHLGTDHTEVYVTPKEAMNVVPLLPDLYDEPFADASQIPTFLIAQIAREHVKVALSGDGGDELFGGYSRYIWGDKIASNIKHIPSFARRGLANTLTAISGPLLDRLWDSTSQVAPGQYRFTDISKKLRRVSELLRMESAEAVYHSIVSHWKFPSQIVIGGTEHLTALTSPELWLQTEDIKSRMMALDTMTYLPDDVLVKVDRAAMAVGLETRVPLLDHRIVEFAWTLPSSMNFASGKGKLLLRSLLAQHIPQQLIDRPKMGFGVPLGAWLRGPLLSWAEELLDEKRMLDDGYLNAAPIQKIWMEHKEGKRDWQFHLWDVLMFQAWLRNQGD